MAQKNDRRQRWMKLKLDINLSTGFWAAWDQGLYEGMLFSLCIKKEVCQNYKVKI